MCREYTHPRADPNSLCLAMIPANTKIGPILNMRVSKVLCIHGIEVQIESLSKPQHCSRVLICKGIGRFVDELHHRDHNLNVPSSMLLRERKGPEHVERVSEIASTRKPVRRERIQKVLYRSRRRLGNRCESFRKPCPEPVCYRKKIVPMRDREWITIPAFDSCNKNYTSSAISKMVTRMLRHHDQDERDHVGAAHNLSQIIESSRRTGRTKLYAQRSDSSHSSREKQDKVRMPKFQRSIGVHSSDPGTYWR